MRTKKIRLGTNTKMYKTISQTQSYLKELADLTEDIDRELVDIFVIPSHTALETASKTAADAGILLGAQNMCWEDEGQFTGEISPVMLKEVGVRIVEIGHSERRHIFGEDDGMVNRKVRSALQSGFIPLLCVGETEMQKDSGIADEVLSTQIKLGLKDVPPTDAGRIWVAYEPVWAIGVNGKPATAVYAGERHRTIRLALEEIFGENLAREVSLLYGGSVNVPNACEYIVEPEIDGLFIGRSAWDASNFNQIISNVLDTVSITELGKVN